MIRKIESVLTLLGGKPVHANGPLVRIAGNPACKIHDARRRADGILRSRS